MLRSRDRRGLAAVAAAVAVSVFAVGGAPRWALCAVAGLSVVALATAASSRRSLASVSPLLVLLGVSLGLTMVQLVPFPAFVLEALNPAGYELVAGGAELLGDSPTFLPLSLDPPNTLFEALELATLLALAYVCLRIATSERGRAGLLAIVAIAAAGAALVALGGKLVGAESLYGIYRPALVPQFLGPLVNPNHLACLLAMGALVSAGLVLRTRQSVAQRAAWGAAGLLSLVVCLLTESRGAAVGLALGAAVFIAALLVQRRPREATQKRVHMLRATIPIAVVMICGLSLVVFFSAGGVGDQLAATKAAEIDAPLGKVVAWRSAARLVEESPWVGVGRGAFEPAFTRLHPASAAFTYSHLENEYLQAVVDWGLPGALLIALALAWLMIVAAQRLREGPLAAGALGALAVVAAQSAVDFGLALPGVALPVLAIASTLTYPALRDQVPARHARLVALRLAGGAAVALLAVVVATPVGRTLRDDQQLLLATGRADLTTARALMARHPLDYLAVGRAADALAARRDPAALQYLNRALVLHPTHPDLHRLAARLLYRAGHRSQALLEYATAIAPAPNPVELIAEVIRAFPDPDDAVRALPPDHANPRRVIKILEAGGHEAVAQRYVVRVLERGQPSVGTLEFLAMYSFRGSDRLGAELAARRWLDATASIEAAVILARILIARSAHAEAEQALLGALAARPGAAGQDPARMLLAEISMATRDWPRARERLHELRASPSINRTLRRKIHVHLTTVEQALGNNEQAELERERERALR
jgi:O-antigen ligase